MIKANLLFTLSSALYVLEYVKSVVQYSLAADYDFMVETQTKIRDQIVGKYTNTVLTLHARHFGNLID